jgi:hypothetical protein
MVGNKALIVSVRCGICGCCFLEELLFITHWRDCHPEMKLESPKIHREFKNIILELGAGHLELNAGHVFLSSETNWKNFVELSLKGLFFI